MKAMVLAGKGKLELMDFPAPELNAEGVIVKIEAAAICNATDTRVLDADDPTAVWPNQAWPFVMGHEICGEVIEVGDEVEGWSRGERIAGWCPPYGGFAEYCQMYPGYMAAVKVPDALPSDIGALFEPAIGTARYFAPAAVSERVKQAKTAYVAGLGPTGILYVGECRLLGVDRIIATDTHPSRRQLAKDFGADETYSRDADPLPELARNGTDVDVAIDTTGSEAVLKSFLEFLKPGAVVIPFGVGWDMLAAEKEMRKRGIILSSASVDEGRAIAPTVVDWVTSGKLPLERIITRRIRLDDLPEAFESLRRRADIKIVVRM